MTKQEFMNKYNIKMRTATKEDRMLASTTYQRYAEYVITYHNGVEMYSEKGTFNDIKEGLSCAIKADKK